jgi:ribose transport system substrate-binding protein
VRSLGSRGARFALVSAVLGFGVFAASGAGLAKVSTTGAHKARRATAVDIAYVKAQISAAEAVPKFVPPGPAFDASAARGKTVFLIPETSAVPFLTAIDDSIVAVGKQLGVKVVVYPNQGQSTQWVQGMNQAIAQKANAIILGAPPEQLQPQLAQAKAAGIPVDVLHLYDRVMPRPKNITSTVFAPFTAAARLEADWVILDTNGKADAVIITSNEVPPSRYIVAAMQAEFRKHCPSCKTTVIDVPAADWGTKMQPATQSALIKDTNVNYVIPIYDSASQFVIPGILAAGRSGKVKIASYNGTPFVLGDIKSKNTVVMDVGESQDWIGHANMDQVLRLLTGHKAITNAQTPIRVFTSNNITAVGNPPNPNKAFGNSYVAGYTKLWSGK